MVHLRIISPQHWMTMRAWISDVVRGRDLFWSTPPQAAIRTLLGLKVPNYHHHPLLLESQSQKLAKLHGALPVESILEHQSPEQLIGTLAWLAGLTEEPTEERDHFELVEHFTGMLFQNTTGLSTGSPLSSTYGYLLGHQRRGRMRIAISGMRGSLGRIFNESLSAEGHSIVGLNASRHTSMGWRHEDYTTKLRAFKILEILTLSSIAPEEGSLATMRLSSRRILIRHSIWSIRSTNLDILCSLSL